MAIIFGMSKNAIDYHIGATANIHSIIATAFRNYFNAFDIYLVTMEKCSLPSDSVVQSDSLNINIFTIA